MFSMIGCVLFGQKAEPALHIFCHCIVTFSLRIWNAPFDWFGVCVSIPATLLFCEDQLRRDMLNWYMSYGEMISCFSNGKSA